MVLSRLTKITGSGISTDTNWVGDNANYTGIVTANSFVGDGSELVGVASTDNIITGTPATFNTYPVSMNAGVNVAGVATFAGNVSIGGTLTYEDVTNIDSVGLITARSGLDLPGGQITVGNNIKLGAAGVITATSFTGDGANITGVAVTEAPVLSYEIFGPNNHQYFWWGGGVDNTIANPDLFLQRGQTYRFVNNAGSAHPLEIRYAQAGPEFTDGVRGDKTAVQLFTVPYSAPAKLRYQCVPHTNMGGAIYIRGASGNQEKVGLTTFRNAINIQSDDSSPGRIRFYCEVNNIHYVTLKAPAHANFSGYPVVTLPNITGTLLTSNNANISGIVTATGADINGDLDVDGHTNLDNVSIAGVVTATTFSGSGASLTNLPSAQLTGALPAIDGSNLTGITQTTINSNADNRIITGSGTANTLNAESEFTFDGSNILCRAGEGGSSSLNLIADQGDDNGDGWKIQSEQDENDLTFKSNISGSYVDKLKLKSNGQLEVQGNLVSTAEILPGTHVSLSNEKYVYFGTTGTGIAGYSSGIYFEGNSTGKTIFIRPKLNQESIKAVVDGAVLLHHSGNQKLTTESDGVTVTGLMEADRTRNVPITTTQRDALSSPAEGTMIYNNTLKKLQVYTDGNWVSFSGKVINTSGGSVDNNGARSGYIVHTFTSPGVFNTDGPLEGVEIMVVGGGGGGGGHRYGSGGGAGGVIMRPGSSPTPAYPLSSPAPVVVGSGGAAGPQNGTGSNGSNSTFGTGPMQLIGKGGGGGTSYDGPVYPGRSGGSGGGATSRATSTPGGSATQPGTHGAGTDYGNRGGNYNVPGGGWAPCGGGGAGASGRDTPGQINGGGNGGLGVPLSISGNSTYYGGGGAAGIYNNQTSGVNYYGIGGNGGGGSSWNSVPGSYPGHSQPGHGAANSGGGGCGAHGQNPGSIPINNALSAGKSGGSGIVIVAYPTNQPEGDVNAI